MLAILNCDSNGRNRTTWEVNNIVTRRCQPQPLLATHGAPPLTPCHCHTLTLPVAIALARFWKIQPQKKTQPKLMFTSPRSPCRQHSTPPPSSASAGSFLKVGGNRGGTAQSCLTKAPHAVPVLWLPRCWQVFSWLLQAACVGLVHRWALKHKRALELQKAVLGHTCRHLCVEPPCAPCSCCVLPPVITRQSPPLLLIPYLAR